MGGGTGTDRNSSRSGLEKLARAGIVTAIIGMSASVYGEVQSKTKIYNGGTIVALVGVVMTYSGMLRDVYRRRERLG